MSPLVLFNSANCGEPWRMKGRNGAYCLTMTLEEERITLVKKVKYKPWIILKNTVYLNPPTHTPFLIPDCSGVSVWTCVCEKMKRAVKCQQQHTDERIRRSDLIVSRLLLSWTLWTLLDGNALWDLDHGEFSARFWHQYLADECSLKSNAEAVLQFRAVRCDSKTTLFLCHKKKRRIYFGSQLQSDRVALQSLGIVSVLKLQWVMNFYFLTPSWPEN